MALERPDADTRQASAGESVDLAIAGMTCASCAARVERAIRAVPDVQDVAVNLATERAAPIRPRSFRPSARPATKWRSRPSI